MTHAARRRSGASAWKLPVAAIVLVGIATAIGWLSRSILIDFISWWPVWLLLVGLSLWGSGRKVGRIRVSGLVSVVAVVVVATFVWAHIQGWPILPSSAASLMGGPDSGIETAAISAGVDGELSVGPGQEGTLYSVTLIRSGGPVNVPEARERSQGSMASVELTEVDGATLYQFAGWDLELSPGPSWSLSLQGEVDASLERLAILDLQIEGSGTIELGEVVSATPVAISGDFVVAVPEGQPVRVIGPAQVPEGWEHSDSGSSAPGGGEGWVITVPEGSILQIRHG
jgi:hypothetical protein